MNARKFCSVLGFSSAMLTSAHAGIFEESFSDFSACDASFFRTLSRADAWKSVTPLESHGDLGWIKVRNRFASGDDQVDFTAPPNIAGLKFFAYFDEVSDLGSDGLYFYWGFLVAGKVDDVALKLWPLIKNKERLQRLLWRDGEAFARREVKVLDSPWFAVDAIPETPVGRVKIERVLLIEAHEDRRDVVRVSCSLQGGVTTEVLQALRPDIDPETYPKPVSATLYEDTWIPENVDGVVSEAIDATAWWTPKFKKLSYTFSYQLKGEAKENRVTVEMAVDGGLLHVREIYGPALNVQRLMLAGMFQLKSRLNGVGDGRVSLTTDLKLSLPAALDLGTAIRSSSVMRMLPARDGEAESVLSIRCAVGEVFAAQRIFPTLKGRAVSVSCATQGLNPGRSNSVFLEDPGIFITLNGTSKLTGDYVQQVERFEIER